MVICVAFDEKFHYYPICFTSLREQRPLVDFRFSHRPMVLPVRALLKSSLSSLQFPTTFHRIAQKNEIIIEFFERNNYIANKVKLSQI